MHWFKVFARFIPSNTLTAILKLCFSEKQQLHEHYMVWPKPLNVKVNIGSLQHCRREMVILCCVCVCLFAFVCLLPGYISSFTAQMHSLTALLSELLLCYSLFPTPTLCFPLSSTGMNNIRIRSRDDKKTVILADALQYFLMGQFS